MYVAQHQSLYDATIALLVTLWFRFHIELAKCLLFRFRSSDLIPKCERHKTPRTRRERSGAPHASLVYNHVVAWVLWKNLCFFRMVLRHVRYVFFLALPVCRHSAHGMANDLACWQLSLCRTVLIAWQWAMFQKEADLRHYLHTSVLAE